MVSFGPLDKSIIFSGSVMIFPHFLFGQVRSSDFGCAWCVGEEFCCSVGMDSGQGSSFRFSDSSVGSSLFLVLDLRSRVICFFVWSHLFVYFSES